MPYSPTVWVDDSIPDIDAQNLNKIEAGIAAAPAVGDSSAAAPIPVGNGTSYTFKKITNAEVDSAAAIDYAKLNLALSVKNADIAATAAIAYTKLALANSIVNADIATTAAIAYSKLSLAGSVQVSDLAFTPSVTQKLAVVGFPAGNTPAAAPWLSANAAILVPFALQTSQTISAIVVSAGSTQSGNFDVGIYDSSGTRKVSKGSTAQSTLTGNVANSVTVTSTPLAAGQYYLALSADNGTGTFYFESTAPASLAQHQLQVATSFPLPASITPGSTKPSRGLLLSAPAT